jgi:putative ABC transport system permease protein
MSNSPVVAAAVAAVTRRRVQTIVVALVVMLSAATSVLALGLFAISQSPFESAFKTNQGAHTTVSFSAAKGHKFKPITTSFNQRTTSIWA